LRTEAIRAQRQIDNCLDELLLNGAEEEKGIIRILLDSPIDYRDGVKKINEIS